MTGFGLDHSGVGEELLDAFECPAEDRIPHPPYETDRAIEGPRPVVGFLQGLKGRAVEALGHQSRQRQRCDSIFESSQRPAVGAAFVASNASAIALRHVEGWNWEVQGPEDEVAHDGHVGEAVKRRSPGLAARYADGGVGKDRSVNPLPVSGRHDGDDRSTPVLAGDGDVVKIEGLDQGRDAVGVKVESVDSQIARLRAEAEADEVGGDHAHLFPRQDPYDLAPQERPGGVAVEEKDRRAFTFIDEVNRVFAVREHPTLEGKLVLEPWRQRRRREELGIHDGSTMTFLCRRMQPEFE